MKALLERIRKILRDRRTRKFLTRLVSGVAAVVVFITTYALVLPAITMESQAACGIEAHQHDDSCYTEELICGQEESEGHHHTEDCYTVTKDLVCPLEEHRHSAENGCYDENGNLICKLEEHTHTDSCYEEHRELTCGLEETDGHTHTDSCYKKVLTCGKPVHTHSAACYKADPELQSAAVASTGMTSAAAMSDYSEEEYAQEESLDGSIGSQAFDDPEEVGTENQNPGEEIIDEDSSSAETEDNQDANQDADIKDENDDIEISDEGISRAEPENDPVTDLENENADDNSVAAESDDMNRNDGSESKDEKDEKADAFETGDTAFEESADEENLNTEDDENVENFDREGEESASSFSTGFAAEKDEDSYIPEKEALDFNTVLNNKTGIYYHHLEAGETVEDSSAITDWTRVDEDTELSPEDLIRVYLGYTLPADAINATNDIARYRLPDTLHLTDEQIDAINKCENGISSQYVDYSKLEITDIERHAAYLGLESVEGTRTPDEELKEDSQEYISATVKAEKIYDEDNGEYKGTDLIFTFSPYTVEKNAHAYDKDGQPTKAGEKVTGWLMLDFNLGQVDFEEPVITRTAVETSDTDNEDSFNEDNDHIEDEPAENENIEEKQNIDNNTIETVDTEDNTDGESGEKADNGQNHPAAIEHSERTAEVVFVDEGWDENGDHIDKISTTLKVVEETVIDAQDGEASEDDAAENSSEAATENAGEAATEDAAAASTDESADPSDKDKTVASAEEDKSASADDTTAKEAEKEMDKADQVIMPAMSFNDSIKVSTGRPAGIGENAEGTLAEAAESLPEEAEVSVRVEADEGTFPAGTTMVLSAVDQSSIDTLAETLAETVESGDPSAADTSVSDTDDSDNRKEDPDHTEDKEKDPIEGQNNSNTRTYGFQAVDITFLDKDGNEIEPAKPVRVALTSAVVEQAREKVEDSAIADPVVVHVDNEGNAEQMDLVAPEEVEPAKGRSEEELLEEAEKAAESDRTDKAEMDADDNTADAEVSVDEADGGNDYIDADSETADENADDVANTNVNKNYAGADYTSESPVSDNDAAADDTSEVAVDDNAVADDTSDLAEDNNGTDAFDEDDAAVNEEADAAEESATAEGAAPAETAAVDENGENAGTAEFTADSFSVYAIVYTVELYTNVITDSGETYRISVTYDETSGIPQDAELKVKEIKEGDNGYENYYTEAVKAASDPAELHNDINRNESDVGAPEANTAIDEKGLSGENGVDETDKPMAADKTYARFFDIEIWAYGQKVEPAGNVSVSIRLLDIPETDDRNVIKIVHFKEDDIEIIPCTASKDNAENTDITESQYNNQEKNDINSAMEFNFTATSFSVYSVVSYTVDFYWEVNGKIYEISIPGGGFLSFEKLVEVLEIAKTDKEADSEDDQEANSESDVSEGTQVSNGLDKKDVLLLALKDVQVSEETKKFVAKVDRVEFSNSELLWVNKVEEDCTVSKLKEDNDLEVQYSAELTEEQIDEINAQTVGIGDWALISLKQFYTEETLTVTMINGDTWTIRVTDAVPDTPNRNPGTINTVDTYADGVKMWLFNYDTDGNLDNSGNKIKFNGNDHTGKVGFNNSTLASDGINEYSELKFLGWGSDSDYNITSNVDINNFTGLDESGEGKGNKIKALQGIVQNTLDENGYPVLNSQYSSTSLDYLFDPTADTDDRVVYGGENGNVTKLFRKENGYYKFDSNQHYAQFDGDHTFTVYDTTLPQTNKDGSKHNPTRAVGFFPFNSYNNMLQIWDTNQNGNGSHTLYLNPDRDRSKTNRAGVKDLDHHFGVMLEAKFVLPADGKDENGNPIRFDFSGDDDMWVFIDDELVLDIGGIHQPVSGTIDFQNGKAYVVGDHTVAGHPDNTGTNAVATAYGAGVTRNSTGDGNYYFYNDDTVKKKVQLGDGKVHTMKVFYIERGGCDSNCEITFNLPTVKTGNLDLKKVWGDVERQAEEVYYTITANYKEASDANKRDLAKFFSSMTEKELAQYGLTKDNIKQIDANNDGVLDNNDPYVFVVKGSDWELKLKQLRICQDSLQNGDLTHDQVPLTYTVLERYALVGGKIVDAADQYTQAVEKSGAPLPSTSDIVLRENDVSLWQDTTGNNAYFNVTNGPGMNLTVNKDWAQDCAPLSDTTITGVVKRYKLVDKGNTLTIQSVLEDTDNSGIDFSGVTYTVMKNGEPVGNPISFADAQAGKNLELPDSGPYTVVENNVPGTPQGYSVVHDPQNQQHNVTLDPNGNTTVTFTSTYKQVNKPSNSTYLIRDYYYYNYQGGKNLDSGNIEFPVGARVTMKFKCKNGNWPSRDMKAEYNGETVSITASADYYFGNPQNLEFTVGPFTVVENGQLVVDVNTNGNNNHDGFVSGSVNFTQVRSLHSMRAMRMPLNATPQKTDLTFSQDLNETTLASLPDAPEGKHYVLDNWSKEVILDAASEWTKTVAVDVGNNNGDYYYFLASVTEHNVAPDTQGTITTNTDGSIRFAYKHADSNLPFEIENKLAKGSLKITKNVTINNVAVESHTKPSLADGTYTFAVTKKGDSSFVSLTVTVTITNGKASTKEVTKLDPGTYIVKEISWENHTTLTMINNETTTSDQAEVVVEAGKVGATAPVVSFTNNLVNTNIRVIKVKEGTEAPISGAKFTLTRVDGDGRIITGNEAYSQEKTAGSDGTLEFTDLWAGRYKLEETFTPDGYIKKEGPYYITIGQNGTGTLDNAFAHTMISPETGNEYTVENEPGVELPYTGGPGTRVYTILGFILVTFTGIFLMRRQLPID